MRLINTLPLIFPIAAIACGGANEKMKMASLLQQDDEFHYFIGEKICARKRIMALTGDACKSVNISSIQLSTIS